MDFFDGLESLKDFPADDRIAASGISGKSIRCHLLALVGKCKLVTRVLLAFCCLWRGSWFQSQQFPIGLIGEKVQKAIRTG